MTTFSTPARAAAFNLSSVIRPAVSSCARAEPSEAGQGELKYRAAGLIRRRP